MKFELKTPIKGEDGATIKSLDLKEPNVGHLLDSGKADTKIESDILLLAFAAGLDPSEIKSLAVSDYERAWKTLNELISPKSAAPTQS